jgi:hypothetical protein
MPDTKPKPAVPFDNPTFAYERMPFNSNILAGLPSARYDLDRSIFEVPPSLPKDIFKLASGALTITAAWATCCSATAANRAP